MTKKRITALVALGCALFIIAASVGMFLVCMEIESEKFRDNAADLIYYNFGDFSWNYEKDENHKAIAENSGMSDISVFMQKYLEDGWKISIDYPLLVKAVDEEGNWYEAYGNYVKVNLEKEQLYINLDEYMTQAQKDAVRDMPGVSEVKLGHNGEKYVLNEITFTDYSGHKETFTYSDSEPTAETTGIVLYFAREGLKAYDKKYFSELEETIEKDYELNHSFDSNGGGAYTSAEESNGNYAVEIAGKKYMVYYAMKYNLPLRAITSPDFMVFSIMSVILCLAAGAVFLILCLKFYTKSEAIENSKRTFISAASHELKTPLAVIQNQCECIMENVAPEKNDKYVESIYDEALRMNEIVSSLLIFNRISYATKVEKEKYNLTQLLSVQTQKYLSFAQSKDVQMTVEADEEIFVKCEPHLMELAIANYLSNAVKYATGENTVKVSLSKEKDEFCLEVFNTGEHIDKKKVEVLWGILERSEASRTRDGSSTGMGLPICKRIFDLHGFYGGYKEKDNGVVFYIKGKCC